MLRILLLLIPFSLTLADCHINLFQNYIIFEPDNLSQNEIEKSNCPPEIDRFVINKLSSTIGRIDTRELSDMIYQEYRLNIKITPETSVNILSGIKLLNEKLNNDNLINADSKLISPQKNLTYDSNEQINIKCDQCNKPGTKTIELDIVNKRLNTIRNYWISSRLLTMRYVYQLTEDLKSHQQNINSQNFIRLKKAVADEHYFDDFENIHFYKMARTKSKGEVLKWSDVIPKKLIQSGQKIKIILKNSNLDISTVGVATRSGAYGEDIEVLNPKSQKKYTAKVVNYKTGEIDL